MGEGLKKQNKVRYTDNMYRLRVGRGSNAKWQGQHGGGRGLICGLVGAVMLKNASSKFGRIIPHFGKRLKVIPNQRLTRIYHLNCKLTRAENIFFSQIF